MGERMYEAGDVYKLEVDLTPDGEVKVINGTLKHATVRSSAPMRPIWISLAAYDPTRGDVAPTGTIPRRTTGGEYRLELVSCTYYGDGRGADAELRRRTRLPPGSDHMWDDETARRRELNAVARSARRYGLAR